MLLLAWLIKHISLNFSSQERCSAFSGHFHGSPLDLLWTSVKERYHVIANPTTYHRLTEFPLGKLTEEELHKKHLKQFKEASVTVFLHPSSWRHQQDNVIQSMQLLLYDNAVHVVMTPWTLPTACYLSSLLLISIWNFVLILLFNWYRMTAWSSWTNYGTLNRTEG